MITGHTITSIRGPGENAFGILAAKWRVFGRATEDITEACITLKIYLCDADQTQPETKRYINPVLMDAEWTRMETGSSERHQTS